MLVDNGYFISFKTDEDDDDEEEEGGWSMSDDSFNPYRAYACA
eukprot:CAMPEP_0168195910 /NCGR_PEP_ID=MMETSP0139_2-20121125/20166_1 /TAXON_ID=44445 /ORGANISM="Pseudo-nitzschia australis, Strain 10249 10 AB" /LENGTH=42 /DNA_ID= /DNA_START= /DNA_END= /DNA_ORIENTATION=